jgi:hypothetical protein
MTATPARRAEASRSSNAEPARARLVAERLLPSVSDSFQRCPHPLVNSRHCSFV